MAIRGSDKIRCSFCNKTEDQVRKLVAGPGGVYICDECIDICAEIIDEELEEETMVIHGDARDVNLLKEENIKNTQGFVALTGNDEMNILACLTAKKLGVRKTIAMIDNPNYLSMAESLDIGTLINKQTIAASYIYQMMAASGYM